jgi:hypothetical protein
MATVQFAFVVEWDRHVEQWLVVDRVCFVVAAVDQTPAIMQILFKCQGGKI